MISLQPPTRADLRIGRGIPSGKGGLWRIFDLPQPPFVVFTDTARFDVETAEDWAAVPKLGLQVVAVNGGVWKGADEYRLDGVSKFGTYLDDETYWKIEGRARQCR